jgi:hypothetical protein
MRLGSGIIYARRPEGKKPDGKIVFDVATAIIGSAALDSLTNRTHPP